MPKQSKDHINLSRPNGLRKNWGKNYTVLPKLDLLDIQRQSYKWFLEVGIGQVIQEISPVQDFTEKNWTLTLGDYRLGKASTTPATCLIKGLTFDTPLYVHALLSNKKTGAEYKQEVFLGDM